MGRIYEGETKLNILQVCDKLRDEITDKQARLLASKYVEGGTNKRAFAHMVLDAYRIMPSETEHDMMIKKLIKHLMERYMKSNTAMDGEESAIKMLIDDIMEKAKH